ncbi:MAG: hypothetical protein IH598_03365 [Bacteroidales bacterium]|nr:hypothetical protein [Bacteroidales bacterium]
MLPSEQKLQFKKFLVINLIAGAFLFAFYGFAVYILSGEYLTPMMPAIIAFFVVIHLFIFYYKLKILKTKNSKFINLLLLLNSLKMILFIAIIAIYAFFFRSDALNFAVGFFICYAVFTTILVRHFNILQRTS